MSRCDTVEVAVSVLRDAQGRVLLAERTARQVAAGFWELPGGKIDPGESAAAAAARELREEIGVQARALVPWFVHEHAFPTKRVRLHLFHVSQWAGTPHGVEGQRLVWVDPQAPQVAPLLPSNARALAVLGLPPRLAVSRASEGEGTAAFVQRTLPALLAAGVRLLLLREPRLAPAQLVQFARRVVEAGRGHGLRVLLAGTPLAARQCGASGVYSSAQQLRALHARPDTALWAVGCHGEVDLHHARALGADFAIVAPVKATAAHPHDAPLGWAWLAQQAATFTLPLYAQGGLGPGDLADARRHGAVGVAAPASAWAAAGASAGRFAA
jgi:8-oxo-dGTP diphosphatase